MAARPWEFNSPPGHKVNVTLVVLEKLAKALNVSVDELLR